MVSAISKRTETNLKGHEVLVILGVFLRVRDGQEGSRSGSITGVYSVPSSVPGL